MRNFLKRILVVQEVENSHRLNPYNPLSYIALIIGMVIGIFAFFIEFKKSLDFLNEAKLKNPFKWN